MEEETESLYCNDCDQVTRHNLRNRFIDEKKGYDEDGNFHHVETVFEVWTCGGCYRSFLIRERHWCDEDDEYEDGRKQYYDHVYPSRHARKTPNWLYSLPDQIKSLLEEIYSALDNNLLWLVGIGCRTVIERVLTDKLGDGTFQNRLKLLYPTIITDEKLVSEITTLLQPCDGSAHRGFVTTRKEAQTLMECIENMLYEVYVRDGIDSERREKLGTLNKRVPPKGHK